MIKIKRHGDKNFVVFGDMKVEMNTAGPKWKTVMKRPLPTNAKQMNTDFEIDTPEGTMKGEKGDWLMEGVFGEMYLCKKKYFDATHDIIGD